MINGTDWPPVNGSAPSVSVTTVVDVMNGEVVVVLIATVDPATFWVVVVSGMVVLVVVDGSVVVVVVSSGWVVVVVCWGWVVVVVVDGLVVVEPWVVDVLVLVEVLLLVGGLVVVEPNVVDVLVLVEVLLVEDVDDVDDVDDEVVGFVGPQNWTCETFGGWPFPTAGKFAFVKFPSNCGGAIHTTWEPAPPFTITAEIARVECQVAPRPEASVRVTTFSLPAGFSKT